MNLSAFWDLLNGWGETVDEAVWVNRLNAPRRAHMHAYMTVFVADNAVAALDDGLKQGRFTLDDIGRITDDWITHPNAKFPTDRAAVLLLTHWLYRRTLETYATGPVDWPGPLIGCQTPAAPTTAAEHCPLEVTP